MKVLIVDDEELTRNGLVSAVDWKKLHIDQVIQAEDGMQALTMAKEYRPEIILSDVRMPRMNGIDMAKEIQTFLPDSSIIFMSGYSDKEYLKEAIRLKAISYVEKPINLSEIEDAITQAIENHELRIQSIQLKSISDTGRLALSFTHPPGHPDILPKPQILSLIESLELPITDNTWFTTIILKSMTSVTDIAQEAKSEFFLNFQKFLNFKKLHEIHVIKYDQYFVFHVFSEQKPDKEALIDTGKQLTQTFPGQSAFFVAIGQTVTGYKQIYSSYSSAVILLQNSFFHEYNSILIEENKDNTTSPVYTDPCGAFETMLSSLDADACETAADDIFHMFAKNQNLLPMQVKDVYYRLFMAIRQVYKEKNLSSLQDSKNLDSILATVQQCNTLTELHLLLKNNLQILFKNCQQEKPVNSTILAIQDFVKHNYNNESLSVKDISEAVFMSSSYVCTLFKNETGLTLNQYITDIRMEKARQLLADPSYKITDIASRTGYSDSNYFAKLFKKHVGLSPTEYREKKL